MDRKLELPNYLFIFDDCINDFKIIEKTLEYLSTVGRHLKLSFWITSQSHKKLSNVIRRNSTNIILHGLNLSDELESVCSEYRGSLTKKALMDIYYRTQEDDSYACIMIDQRAPVKKRLILNCES